MKPVHYSSGWRLVRYAVSILSLLVLHMILLLILLVGIRYELWRTFIVLMILAIGIPWLIFSFVAIRKLEGGDSTSLYLGHDDKRISHIIGVVIVIIACALFFLARGYVFNPAVIAYGDDGGGFAGGSLRVAAKTKYTVSVIANTDRAAFVVAGDGEFELRDPPNGFPESFLVRHKSDQPFWGNKIFLGRGGGISRKVEISGDLVFPNTLAVDRPIRLSGHLFMPIIYAHESCNRDGYCGFTNESAIARSSDRLTIWVLPESLRGAYKRAPGDYTSSLVIYLSYTFLVWIASINLLRRSY